ncbi:MAG: hypothetical protein PHF46_02150 [Candidatus Gracilibacteria bacterium]|nr:hypothetical protein [Candidatus Gracilibacteria bacterium]MDD3120184.1 hypothetical protein [Candidatus Gracilibacteria bacterium]
MKKAIYVVSFLVLFFLGNVLFSFLNADYRDFLRNKKTEIIAKFDSNLSGDKQKNILTNKEKEIKIESSFIPKVLADKINGKFELEVSEDKIFGEVFSGTTYKSFNDKSKDLKIFIVDKNYDYFFEDLKSRFRGRYELKEVNDMFFGKTTYLNSMTEDSSGIIRFIFFVGGKTIGIEVSKNNYDLVKNILKN